MKWSKYDVDAAEDSRQYLQDQEDASRHYARQAGEREWEPSDIERCPTCGGANRHRSSCRNKDWQP